MREEIIEKKKNEFRFDIDYYWKTYLLISLSLKIHSSKFLTPN